MKECFFFNMYRKAMKAKDGKKKVIRQRTQEDGEGTGQARKETILSQERYNPKLSTFLRDCLYTYSLYCLW